MNYSHIIDRLLALGLAPIPVAPYQDPNDTNHRFYKYLHQSKKVVDAWENSTIYEPILEADGTLKPKFTGKNPSFLKPNGFPKTVEHKHYQNTLPTQEDFELWFANLQNGIGCLGNHRYRWLDLDRKHFDSQDDCDRALLAICPHAKDGWLERTQSGGYRLLVDCGESGADFTNFALTEGGDHVGELLGSGRYAVLAPSIGVNGSYINLSYGDPIPLSALNIFTTSPKKAAVMIKPSMPRITSSDAIELFNCITPAVQSIIAGNPESDDRSLDLTKAAKELYGWENWLNANGISFNGSADSLINDCGDALGIDSDRIERIKKTIDSVSCLPACVMRGGDEPAQKRIKKLSKAPTASSPQSQPQPQSDEEKQCKIKYLDKKITGLYGDRFKLNLLRSEIELDGEVFDLDQARHFFGTKHNINCAKADAIDTVRAIAISNQYHPVQAYLESCAAQYPKSNILDDFASKVFGTSEPIYATYIKKMLVGAVARIFKPGVKNDTCLILQGKQGSRKSSFFHALGGAWFTDNCDKNLTDKDNLLRLHRHWIIELGEIDRIVNSRHEGELKRFLSSPSDVVRKPYERMSKELDRGFIFVGSTNRDDFLSDATGDRRFWVIPVRQNIDTDYVALHRDQIWAAAVELYRSGYAWHLSAIEDAAREKINERYRSLSPWHSMIESYLIGRDRTSTNEIIAMIQPDASKLNRAMQREIADVLTTLGWLRNGSRHRALVNGSMSNMLHTWVQGIIEVSSKVSCSKPYTEPLRTDNEGFGGIIEVSSKVSCSNLYTEPLTEVLIPSDTEKTPKLYKIDAETCKSEITKQENNFQMFEAKNRVSGYQNTHDVVTEPLSRDTLGDTFVIPSKAEGIRITIFDIGKMVIDTRTGYQGELKSFERNSEGKTVAKFGDQVALPEFLRVVT